MEFDIDPDFAPHGADSLTSFHLGGNASDRRRQVDSETVGVSGLGQKTLCPVRVVVTSPVSRHQVFEATPIANAQGGAEPTQQRVDQGLPIDGYSHSLAH